MVYRLSRSAGSTLGLSTEISYQDSGPNFTDGDVLALGGSILTLNKDLVTPFEPRARMLGLDALTYPARTGQVYSH